MKNDGITARVIGALFLVATFAFMAGEGIVQSVVGGSAGVLEIHPNRIRLTVGVVVQFVGATANVAIGVLFFTILKRHSETIAVSYVVTRIFDGAGIAIVGTAALALIPLSRDAITVGLESGPHFVAMSNLILAGSDVAFSVTMIALGAGSIPFAYLLIRSRQIPRSLALLGLIGYAALCSGSILELFDVQLSMVHYAPGGLFELILPFWLFVKGFNPKALPG